MDMQNTRSTLQRTTVICAILALVAGLLTGAVDFNATEPQPAALMVLVFAGILGFSQPRNAWRWAIIVVLGSAAGTIAIVTVWLSPARSGWAGSVRYTHRVDSGLHRRIWRGIDSTRDSNCVTIARHSRALPAGIQCPGWPRA